MKRSEYYKEADDIIKDLFSRVLESNNKEEWKRTLDFITTKTYQLELTCGEWKHSWRKVREIMLNKYGKKFITKK